MKIELSTEETSYIANVLMRLAANQDEREIRRKIIRLANKFSPNSPNIDLSPVERIAVLELSSSYLSLVEGLKTKAAEDTDKLNHINRVEQLLVGLKEKLNNAATQSS